MREAWDSPALGMGVFMVMAVGLIAAHSALADDSSRVMIEEALLDEDFLQEEHYLDEDDSVPVIIEFSTWLDPEDGDRLLNELFEDKENYSISTNLQLESINSVSATIPLDALEFAGSLEAVERIWLDWRTEIQLVDSVSITNATASWKYSGNTSYGSINDLPLQGEGVKIGIVDTGLAYDHIEFGACEKPINYSTCDRLAGGWNYVSGTGDPYDDHGHGTHVSGIIGAEGENIQGIANRTTLLPFKACDRWGSCFLSDTIDSIETGVAKDANLINLSIGGFGSCDLIEETIRQATQKGVIIVASAGNQGPESGTIVCPASSEHVLAVGATYKGNTLPYWSCEEDQGIEDELACFSSRGPTEDGRVKPEIVAPGKDIESTLIPTDSVPERYGTMSGTSTAAPHVAGATAILVQAVPELEPIEVKERLQGSSILPSVGPDHRDGENGYGWGRLDILRAIDDESPRTSLHLEGKEGDRGWFIDDVTAEFTTTDAGSSLGITTGPRELYWYHDQDSMGETVTLNGLKPDAKLTGEDTITDDGVHTLTAHGVDNGGNTEANKSWTVKIDQTPPTTERSLQADGNGTLVTLTPNDATSGIDSTHYQVNDDAWQVYEDAFLAQPGDEVRYQSTDVAGNEEAITVFDVPDVSFEEPKDGHVTLTAGDTRIEEPLPAPLQTTHNPGAITIGTVEFEIHVGTQHSNVTTAQITITDSMGQHVDTVDLTYNHTTPDDKHVWTGTWTPPPDQALEHLTAEAGVTNADGAHAATSTTLTTIGHPEDTANTSLFLLHPLVA